MTHSEHGQHAARRRGSAGRPRGGHRVVGALVGVAVAAAGVPAVLAPAAAEPLGPSPIGAPAPPAAPADTPVSAGSATVTGSGFGHGVGMSQYGALGMARAGYPASGILSHYYTGVRVGAVKDAVALAVNVAHGTRGLTLAPVALSGTGHRLRLTTPEGVTSTLAPGDRVGVVVSGDRVRVTVTRAAGSPGTGPTSFRTTRLAVRWTGTRALAGAPTLLTSTAALPSSTKKRSYRWGALSVSALDGLVEAVLDVDVHTEYLRGVAEMPSSWPTAALQAQAIVARSYALVAVATTARSSCGGCQIWDDQRSQVYTGWAKESERVGSTDYGARWVAAVAATQPSATTGTAVLYQGRPINAVYSSSSGGRTRSSASVWGGSVPYLAPVDDPWSIDSSINPGFAAWSRTVGVAGLTSLFGVRDLLWVGVTARDGSGAATRVEAVSGSGKRLGVDGETFRRRLGLPSSWVAEVTLPTG